MSIVLLYISALVFLSDVGFAFGKLPEPEAGGSCQDVIVLPGEKPKPQPPEPGFELKYPSIQGIVPKASGKEALPTFVKYIFYFGIAISGFIAFGVMVYSGVLALASAGVNPSALQEAKRGIIAGFLGVLLLLGSAILLNTINPQLVEIKLEKVEANPIEKKIGAAAGVYLLGEASGTEEIASGDKILTIRKNVGTTGSIPALGAYDFDNKTEDLCIEPNIRKNLLFHAVLHTEDNYKGSCRVFYDLLGHSGDLTTLGVGGGVSGDVSAVTVFTSKIWEGNPGEDFSADFAVRFYKNAQFFDDPEDDNDVCTLSAQEISSTTPIGTKCPGWKKEDVSSLKVGYGWVLAAFEKEGGEGRCEIFGTGEVPELRTHYIGQCKPTVKVGPFEGLWKPCVSSIAIFKGRLQ